MKKKKSGGEETISDQRGIKNILISSGYILTVHFSHWQTVSFVIDALLVLIFVARYYAWAEKVTTF